MKKQYFRIRLLPVIAFVAVVFLIVGAHTYNIDVGDMLNLPFSGSTQRWDVFCYVKSLAILVISLWAGLILAFLLITGQKKIKITYIYIPMLIYTIMVIASYILSDYKSIAWMGGMGRFEGTRTLLCYMFMLFYTINVVDDIRDVIIIVAITAIAIFVACLLGFTQLINHDFYLTNIGKFLIAGANEVEVKAQFAAGQVYQSVGNMNYVGMYLVMIIPALIYGLYFFISKNNKFILLRNGIDEKKRLAVIAFIGILLLLIILNVYGSHSLGGCVGIGLALVVLLIILCNKKWQKVSLTIAMLVCLFGGLIFIYILGKDTSKQIDYIETDMDRVWISIDGNTLVVDYERENGEYSFWDGEGKFLNLQCYVDESGAIRIDDSRYGEKVSAIPFNDENKVAGVVLDVHDHDHKAFVFMFRDDGAKYINPFGQEVALDKIESIGFKGHISAGSGRGYIWSRTLPLLKKCLITGFGADTFMMVFPQSDYAGKYSVKAHLDSVCDKAHNMYLGMATGTGIVSLISFLAIIVMAMWNVFHLHKENLLVKIIAAGLCGFLIAGLFYDSSVSTMPMFIGLLGTSVAMCMRENN